MTGAGAGVVVDPWSPLFKGIDRSLGTNYPSTAYTNAGVVRTNDTLQVAICLRIDLLDPDIRLFTTPRYTNYIGRQQRDGLHQCQQFREAVRRAGGVGGEFLRDLQRFIRHDRPAVRGAKPHLRLGHLDGAGGVGAGLRAGQQQPLGFHALHHQQDSVPRAQQCAARHEPAGIHTAVSGYYAVLTNGVIIGNTALAAAFPDPTYHQLTSPGPSSASRRTGATCS